MGAPDCDSMATACTGSVNTTRFSEYHPVVEVRRECANVRFDLRSTGLRPGLMHGRADKATPTAECSPAGSKSGATSLTGMSFTGKRRRYFGAMTSRPQNGWSTSGTRKLPSSCWACSIRKTSMRAMATAVPLSVCTNSVPFSVFMRVPRRRAE